MYFDYVEERESNGSFYVVAVDSESRREYVLSSRAVIRSSACTLEGHKLAVSIYPETYIYRGKLTSKEQANELSQTIGRLIINADFKSNSIFNHP